VSEGDVRFAQTALDQLGYKLGEVDGFWGERSEIAMRAFEKSRNLKSANGALSELNLYALSKATKVARSEIESSIRNAHSLAAKIDPKVPLSTSPQLIIVDQTYSVLAKANPYSEVITTLQPGTGIYVIAVQNGWFEIESLSRQKGFIRENLN
jgi:peptidoglycan hydrolase-like protein with peptidoglycan-binding domain